VFGGEQNLACFLEKQLALWRQPRPAVAAVQ
jgi:hypothetical protein